MRATLAANGLIAHYIHSYIVIAAQKAACNCLHDVNQRLCRWLSMMAERLPEKDMFPFRQEFLAYMLGVHRPTVSIAAEELQRQGLIRYSRGHLRILDREGLRARSCECYEVIARQLRQMLAASSNSEHAELSPSFEIRLHRDGCGHPEGLASDFLLIPDGIITRVLYAKGSEQEAFLADLKPFR